MDLSLNHSDAAAAATPRRRGVAHSISMVWRLVMVTALPALPLAYLLTTTWIRDSNDLQSARLELVGSKVSTAMLDVRQGLDTGGANTAEALVALDKALGGNVEVLKAKAPLDAVKQAWGQVGTKTGAERNKALDVVSTKVEDLSKLVNETSGVILDPDDVSYHLMLGYAQSLPEAGGHLHEIAQATADLRPGPLSPEVNAELTSLLAQTRDPLAVIRNSIADAKKAGPEYNAVVAPTEAWLARTDALVAQARSAMQQGKDAGAALAALSGSFVTAGGGAYAEARRWIGAFDKCVNERIGNIERERLIVAVLTTVCSLLSLYLLIGIWNTLRGGIVSMRLALERIGKGDLNSAVKVDGKDEIAAALNAIYDMQQALARAMTEVRSVSDSLGTAGGEIAAGNQDLASRTEQQAASLQQTAASLKQLEDTVQRNVGNAQKASELVATASRVAHDGGTAVKGVVDTMGSIQSSSQKISEITGVIDGIAFQTNILALNAAVEAARAGEQGRGFAVVATEVRALAKRSAMAAREIKTLIESSVEDVNQGARQVQSTTETIGEVVNAVERASRLMEEIAAASREQGQGISEVTKAVGQMDTVTQQNAALVEETAAASESLKVQAHSLVEVLSRFRTGGQAYVPA